MPSPSMFCEAIGVMCPTQRCQGAARAWSRSRCCLAVAHALTISERYCSRERHTAHCMAVHMLAMVRLCRVGQHFQRDHAPCMHIMMLLKLPCCLRENELRVCARAVRDSTPWQTLCKQGRSINNNFSSNVCQCMHACQGLRCLIYVHVPWLCQHTIKEV